jgi:hypothetical protein
VDCNRARRRERDSIEHSPLRASIESKKKTKKRRKRTTTAESSIPVHIITNRAKARATIEMKKYIHTHRRSDDDDDDDNNNVMQGLKTKLFLVLYITKGKEELVFIFFLFFLLLYIT